MSWGAVAAGAAAVIGGGLSLSGSSKAAGASEKAAAEAAFLQGKAQQTQLGLIRPQLEVSNSALSQLASIYGLQQPSALDFTGRSATTAGLQELPGTAWQGRPVYTDGEGGLYSVRGRNGTIDRNGLSYIGKATEGRVTLRGGNGKPKSVVGPDGRPIEFQGGQFIIAGQALENQQPQQQQAQQGINPTLQDLLENNPAVNFQREQGERALSRSAAARGLNQSGGTLKDFIGFNSDLAAANFQNTVVNPLFQLAGFGPQATQQAGSALQTGANNLGNIALQNGATRASAFQNQGNILGNLVSGLPSYFQGNNQNPLDTRLVNQGLQNANTGEFLQGPPVG